jgi:hypothetical protein
MFRFVQASREALQKWNNLGKQLSMNPTDLVKHSPNPSTRSIFPIFASETFQKSQNHVNHVNPVGK